MFFAWPGVPPEFAFRDSGAAIIEAPEGRIERAHGSVYIGGLLPGLGSAIRIRNHSGHVTQIVLLSRDQARNIWKAPLGGRERLVLSPAGLYFDAGRIHLAAGNPALLTFSVLPGLDRPVAGFQHAGREGVFDRYTASVSPLAAEPVVQQLSKAGPAAPVKMGQEVAMAPAEAAFDKAARWSIRVPDVKSSAVGEIFLRIAYQGDVARIYAGKHLITDDFYHGAPWEIGLGNIPAAEWKQGLELQILPLRQDAPIYLAAGARPAIPERGQVARLIQVQLVPEYRVVADLGR